MAARDSDILLVIDVQNDFCPGGRLAVPGGDEVVKVINRLARDFRHVVLTRDWQTPTGLLGFLRERQFRRIVCTGLAFDYCVCYSAEDAVSHGFDTIVIEEACRAIDLNGAAAATKAPFRDKGIKLT